MRLNEDKKIGSLVEMKCRNVYFRNLKKTIRHYYIFVDGKKWFTGEAGKFEGVKFVGC